MSNQTKNPICKFKPNCKVSKFLPDDFDRLEAGLLEYFLSSPMSRFWYLVYDAQAKKFVDTDVQAVYERFSSSPPVRSLVSKRLETV